MANGEKDCFDTLISKLQGICDANHLTYRFRGNRYPITLTIVPDTSIDGQMSMIEEDQHFNGKDSSLVFCFVDGSLTYRIKGFTLPETTMNKLKNMAKKLHHAHLDLFFRNHMENRHLVDDDAAEETPDVLPEDELWQEDATEDPEVDTDEIEGGAPDEG